MKVTGFQPAVNPQPIGNAQQIASKDLTAYGGNQFGMAMMNKAMSDAQKVVEARIDEKLTADVLAASIDYTKKLNDKLYGENGLMRRQQAGADGISKEFEKIQADTSNEVMGVYKFGGKAAAAYRNMTAREGAQRALDVSRHEFGEMEKYKDTQTLNYLDQQSTYAAMNYGNDEALRYSISNGNIAIQARFGKQGEEVVRQKQKLYAGELLSNTISAAADAGNYEAVNRLAEQYGDLIPSRVLLKAKGFVTEVKNTEDKIAQHNKIYAEYGDDIAGGLAALKNSDAYKYKDVVTGGSSGKTLDIPVDTDVDMNVNPSLKKAIPKIGGMLDDLGLGKGAIITSGYRDKERNARANGAENSYHLKGDAIDIVLPRNLSDSEMEQVKARFGKNFSEVIFHDAGSGNHLHLGGLKGDIGGVASSRREATLKERQQDEAAYQAFVANKTNQINMQRAGVQRSFENNVLFPAMQSGDFNQKALADMARTAAGGDFKLYSSMVTDVNNVAKMLASKNELNDQQKIMLADMIDTGQIQDENMLKTYLKDNGSAANYEHYVNMFRAKQKGEDIHGMDWAGMKQQAFATWGTKDESIWYYSKQAALEFVHEYKMKNNGALPTQFEVQKKLIEYGTKPNGSGYTTQWQNDGIRSADMRMLGLYHIEPVVINGETKYELYHNDGSNAIVGQSEYNAIKEKVKREEIK